MILESISPMAVITVAAAALALVLDLAFGDPRSSRHPTAWMGSLMARLAPAARRCQGVGLQRLGGCLVVVATAAVVLALLAMFYVVLYSFLVGWPTFIVLAVVGGILLKYTIAVRGMERHALAVVESLQRHDGLAAARESLSMIVKRRTGGLDRNHVLSGVLESVGESTVDGVTGPLFYYGILGLPGAFVYRVVNTADSMMGYRTWMFRDVGWFAATADSVLNYLPARITGMVMIAAAAILGYDWRGSYTTMMRDGAKTPSRNAGYPMAALAGALGIRLEKEGHYVLGGAGGDGESGGGGAAAGDGRDDDDDSPDGGRDGGDDGDCHSNDKGKGRDDAMNLTEGHVYRAIRMMKLTSVLFLGSVTVPLIVAISLAGSWLLSGVWLQ